MGPFGTGSGRFSGWTGFRTGEPAVCTRDPISDATAGTAGGVARGEAAGCSRASGAPAGLPPRFNRGMASRRGEAGRAGSAATGDPRGEMRGEAAGEAERREDWEAEARRAGRMGATPAGGAGGGAAGGGEARSEGKEGAERSVEEPSPLRSVPLCEGGEGSGGGDARTDAAGKGGGEVRGDWEGGASFLMEVTEARRRSESSAESSRSSRARCSAACWMASSARAWYSRSSRSRDACFCLACVCDAVRSASCWRSEAFSAVRRDSESVEALRSSCSVLIWSFRFSMAVRMQSSGEEKGERRYRSGPCSR